MSSNHNSGRSAFNYALVCGGRFVIRDRFSDTIYFEEARKESQKLTEELAKDNEAKAKAIADTSRSMEQCLAPIADQRDRSRQR